MYHFPWIKYIDNEYVFYYNLINRELKVYIVIRFSKDCIRFYWRNSNINDLTFPENQQFFAIDLTSSKTIGNDILDINEEKIKKCVEKKNQNKLEEEQITFKKGSINKFLYDFVTEIENDEGIFASSSIVNKVREKLQTSIVYKLIAAKKKYKTHRKFISEGALDTYEYNRIVSEYADLLMLPELSVILPPNKVGKGMLFENPEYELQKIMDKDNEWKNNRKKYDDKKQKQKTCDVNPDIIKKIQNFFLRKHSTISAYTVSCAKRFFIWLIGCMGVWSLLFIIGSLQWECKCFYKSFAIFGLVICLLFFINAWIFNKNSNSLFPRIIIAIIASWLMIGMNAVFVASQLNVSGLKTIITGILCMLIVFLVLIKECREHSPYYPHKSFLKECNIKVFPILSFSVFLSLFIGIIFQLAIFQPLIKTNNVLPSVEFKANFAEIEFHKTQTQLLINSLSTYKSDIFNEQKEKELELYKRHSKTLITLVNSFHKPLSFKQKYLLACITDTAFSQRIDHIDSLSFQLQNNIIILNEFTLKYCNTDSL